MVFVEEEIPDDEHVYTREMVEELLQGFFLYLNSFLNP
jgi:hypothetical protein